MASLFLSTTDVFIEVLSFFTRPQIEKYAIVSRQFNRVINIHLNKQPYRLLYRVDMHTTKAGLLLSYDTNQCLSYLHYEKKGAVAAILPYLAAQSIRAQNLTLWISPIEYSTSREETIPELVDMVERLAHIWRNSSYVAINSCLYVKKQVEMLEDLILGIYFSSKNLMRGKKEFKSSMCLEFSGSFSLLLFRTSDLYPALLSWDEIEFSGLENFDELDGMAKYLGCVPAKECTDKKQKILAVFCFLDGMVDNDKYRNRQMLKEFVQTIKQDFLCSRHYRSYKLHLDCFFGHEKAFSKIVECFQFTSLTNSFTNECLQIKCDKNNSVKMERFI